MKKILIIEDEKKIRRFKIFIFNYFLPDFKFFKL